MNSKHWRWRKLGLVFQPLRSKHWMQSHASLPTPLQIDGPLYRVYFSSRDGRNRSHIGFFEIDLDRPNKLVRVSEEPILAPGPLGHFDDHGVYASSVVATRGKIYLYTIGWNPGITSPLFYSSIGLAISEDGGLSFQRYSPAPIMARSQHDPCLVTAPVVRKDESGWRMWYVSGLSWQIDCGVLSSRYHVKFASSRNGIDWIRNGLVALELQQGERNISRIGLLNVGGAHHAFFGVSDGSGYRLQHAVLDDSQTFCRTPKEVLLASKDGFDSAMISYPSLVVHRDNVYMFYNGNRFGYDGVGLAVTSKEYFL